MDTPLPTPTWILIQRCRDYADDMIGRPMLVDLLTECARRLEDQLETIREHEAAIDNLVENS